MQLAANAHTICDSELRPLGTGLYPVISIINHGWLGYTVLSFFPFSNNRFPDSGELFWWGSCLPNSVLVFEGKMAVVRAVQLVPRGTEVWCAILFFNSLFTNMPRDMLVMDHSSKCIGSGHSKYQILVEKFIKIKTEVVLITNCIINVLNPISLLVFWKRTNCIHLNLLIHFLDELYVCYNCILCFSRN